MNVAVILAGGVGSRVGADVPKQFVEVEGRPVLAYTIERFDRHPEVDAIEVVIRAGWEGYLSDLVEREGFAKVRWTAPAGEDFQHSVINGIAGLEGKVSDDDVILVHYGASPMVPDDVISDAIRVCGLHGNASPAHSQVYLAAERQDGESTTGFVDRDQVMVLNSPQALKYGYAKWLYEEAARRGLLATTEPHTTSLMFAMGERVWFSKGSTANIKITTPDDLKLFRGWVLAGDEEACHCEVSAHDSRDDMNSRASALLEKLSNLGIEVNIDGLKAVLESFHQRLLDFYAELDWASLAKSREELARHGWAPYLRVTSLETPDGLPLPDQADDFYLGYFGDSGDSTLFADLRASCDRPDDLEEAIVLFQEGRYKPCAIMLCVLIDGSLSRLPARASEEGFAKWDGKVSTGEKSISALCKKLPPEGAFYLNVYSVWQTWKHFTKPVKNFDPSEEGDFNRHFLIHGLDSAPVTRETCLKLFCLLNAIGELAPRQE